MPPRRPKMPLDAGSFPTFDDIAADAREGSPTDPYLLPMPDGKTVIEITLNGDQYLAITAAQMVGNYERMFETLFPDVEDRALVRIAFRKAPALMMDRLTGNVLSYFYGNGLQIEAAKGNSPAS